MYDVRGVLYSPLQRPSGPDGAVCPQWQPERPLQPEQPTHSPFLALRTAYRTAQKAASRITPKITQVTIEILAFRRAGEVLRPPARRERAEAFELSGARADRRGLAHLPIGVATAEEQVEQGGHAAEREHLPGPERHAVEERTCLLYTSPSPRDS